MYLHIYVQLKQMNQLNKMKSFGVMTSSATFMRHVSNKWKNYACCARENVHIRLCTIEFANKWEKQVTTTMKLNVTDNVVVVHVTAPTQYIALSKCNKDDSKDIISIFFQNLNILDSRFSISTAHVCVCVFFFLANSFVKLLFQHSCLPKKPKSKKTDNISPWNRNTNLKVAYCT